MHMQEAMIANIPLATRKLLLFEELSDLSPLSNQFLGFSYKVFRYYLDLIVLMSITKLKKKAIAHIKTMGKR